MGKDGKVRPAILFLCLGNICRSPLGEGAARAAFAAAGIDAHIDSAGTGNWHVGHPPDRRAQAEARRRGIDISGLRARQLVRDDFYRFDLILAADESNLRDALAIRPDDATAELCLMLDLVAGRAGQGVTDPYYGSDEGFAATWEDVAAVASALAARWSTSG
ncbi:low molecular weight protein-tyrosine-phosphatase [Sphingopyxis alaskensis]|uniref:low molecular weight protein-tyrosine-phosphatase n=1 Tax=Sphingopyxis alaskensis TaxID=117207 RepID=UPI00391D7907